MATGPTAVIELPAFASLFGVLQQRGYQVVGPTVRDGAVVCDVLDGPEDLPAGWGDEQEAGRYRLVRREGGELFGYTLPAHAWKRFLHPPELLLIEARRDGDAFQVTHGKAAPQRYAFLGVRACELAAMRIHDRVFLHDRYVEPGYRARRAGALVIAVNCTRSARTCFCASTGTGPKASGGYDLCLTELAGGVFVVETGTEAGAAVLAAVEHRDVTPRELAAAASDGAAASQTRSLDTAGLRELMYESFDHPRWEKIAARCFSCGNCTLACPTCFCTTMEDSTDIACEHAERWRKWDSCFTEPFSYIHGGSVRLSVKARYRQWLTHKMAAWVDQFGTTGCTGCGRCITWCPGKIDITEEVAALRGVGGRNGN
jgi:ferredoxin